MTSLGPQVFFLSFSHSIFILLTNFLGTNATTMSICLWGGSLRDDTHAYEQLRAGWDPSCVAWNRGHNCCSLAYLSGYDGPTMSLCLWGGSLSQPQHLQLLCSKKLSSLIFDWSIAVINMYPTSISLYSTMMYLKRYTAIKKV